MQALCAGLLAFHGTGRIGAGEVFVDTTEARGIRFVHVTGARGAKHLPETMAGGAGWLDYDGDGRLDLYLVQGHADSARASESGREANILFRNRPDGSFEDVTERAGVGDRGYGCGIATGDIDNDGDTDLYVTNLGRNTLYVNLGDGRFADATEEAGVACPYWSASAAFADLDGDGLLDLYVANYVLYDTRHHRGCSGNPKKLLSYCHPNLFDGAPDALFLNRGGGKFEDVSRSAGVAVTGRIRSKGLGVLPADFDGDGDIDLFVANDSVPNFLWRNLGAMRFEDAALEAGVALNSHGRAEACMGIDGGDADGDGLFDYFVTNYSEETDTLYRAEGGGFFSDGTYRAGLVEPTYRPLGFGTKLFDYDLDGDLDIYVARGHVIDVIAELEPAKGIPHAQPDQLLENDGSGRFRDVSAESGEWFQKALVGRGAAFADFDSDGDTDIFVVNCADRGVLLENRSADRRDRHWIGLRLEGNGPSNRDGYGSVVEIASAVPCRRAEVRTAASYLAANDPRLVFGLGRERGPVEATVRWPDGLKEAFRALAADRYHLLVRGRGRPAGD